MQAEPEKALTLARDTVFAAVMVILNLLMGLCLLAGSLRHHEQRFQRTGIGAALATLTVLTVVTLVLPNFTSSVPGPFYSATQLGFVAAVSLILYATFALVQTVRHRSEEHTSELQSLMRNSYAVFCLKKKTITNT